VSDASCSLLRVRSSNAAAASALSTNPIAPLGSRHRHRLELRAGLAEHVECLGVHRGFAPLTGLALRLSLGFGLFGAALELPSGCSRS
jgi:hypothetical protein